VVRFGSFELDAGRRQLLSAGHDVHLTPKAFDLLAVLVAAAPRVVPKAELHEHLWPRGAVSDATLTGLIKELRRALGDVDATAPLIRTAHRVGYAFNTSVTGAAAAARIAHWLVDGQRRLPLVDGENLVGRDPRSNVWLDYPTVSRRHARIVVNDGNALVEDLGSKNGTTVGSTAVVEGRELENGDGVYFGRVRLIYCASPAGFPTATHASRIEDFRTGR
jgi:DNA-binding winged helix-turn-helix (wHTH) protein